MTTLAHPSVGSLYQLKARPIRITLVDDLEALWLRKTEWNALVERSETSTVFQTFEWHASWWKTFGREARPLLLLAEAAGQMVGIAPLMVSEQRLLGRKRQVIEFMGAGSSDYCDFIVDPTRHQVLPLMLQWLIESDQQWDLLQLSDIPNTSSTLSALPGFFNEHRYPTDTRLLYEAPTYLFGDPVQDQQLVRKKSLRRHCNYFNRSGQLEFRNCATVDETLGYLKEKAGTHFDPKVVEGFLKAAPRIAAVLEDERKWREMEAPQADGTQPRFPGAAASPFAKSFHWMDPGAA